MLADTCRQQDAGAKLFAYLNGWYVWIKPQHLLQTFVLITAATRSGVTTIQRHFLKQLLERLTTTPVHWSVLLSQSTSHTGAHLMQPSSEAYEAEDRCFRVAVARRLMLPHPAASDAADVAHFFPNKSAAGLICNKPVDLQQHHCYGCRYGGGVDRRHAAVARRLADVIHSQSGTEVFMEQEVPALTRVVNGQREHARMDRVFNLNGSATCLDVSIVAPFSCNPSLVAAASTRPGHMAKRAEKTKFDRYPHINIVSFMLETTVRPGLHARKFISNLMKDADNPPLAIRVTWSAIPRRTAQRHLQTTTCSCRYVTPRTTFAIPRSAFYAVPRYVKCWYRPHGNACRGFSLKPALL